MRRLAVLRLPRAALPLAALAFAALAACGDDGPTARRTVALTAVDYDVPQLRGFAAQKGEEITFTMTNNGAQPHNLELLTADGTRLGRLDVVQPGATGTFTVRMKASGSAKWVCDIADHVARGMRGAFVVT
ncbi:MAG: cupredoxin domain-containing protein [Acidimicrobiales bacterium]